MTLAQVDALVAREPSAKPQVDMGTTDDLMMLAGMAARRP